MNVIRFFRNLQLIVLKNTQKLVSMDILYPEIPYVGGKMEGTLKDYYVTTGMIAKHWNENGYLTEKGTSWDADKVGKKFKKILGDVEKAIGSKQGDFEDLYRSKNGESGCDFIFFDAGEIIEYKQKIYGESVSEYMKLIKNNPISLAGRDYCEPSENYADVYETDTYDSLQCVFDLCRRAGGVQYLTSDEIEIVGKKLENLVPLYQDIDKLKETMAKALNEADPEDKEAYKIPVRLIRGLNENKQKARSYINQLYIETRKAEFYKKRIFVKENYVKNGQIDCLKEWVEKWTYVIDHMVSVYRKPEEAKLDVRKVLKVLLIWYQNEKRKGIISDSLLKKGFDTENINTFSSGEVAKTLKSWVSGLAEYKKSEFISESEDGYFFVIKQAFEDLEKIYEKVIENTKSMERKKQDKGQRKAWTQKFEQNGKEDILPYLLECIEIMEPHIERISMIPDMEKAQKTE